MMGSQSRCLHDLVLACGLGAGAIPDGVSDRLMTAAVDAGATLATELHVQGD
jgi:hypothetical protein